MTPFVHAHLRPILQDKKILLGITGSIAAFKACDLVRFLRASGAQVRVVLSQGAENFVTATTLENLSGHPVLQGFWDEETRLTTHGTHHIETARWADLILVAPATAHFVAKMANGFADDLLSTEILVFTGPVCIAPAMNPAMYQHPAVQENIAKLKTHGVSILGPSEGLTTCGEEGLGRMMEPDLLIPQVAKVLAKHKAALSDIPPKRLLVSLGPTRSPIDPVRYISNRSSGLMGASLCWAGFERGWDVVAVCGPTQVELPPDSTVISVQTAVEMRNAVLAHWKTSDLFISTAAVLDWEVANPALVKLKKGRGLPSLQFSLNPDILAEAVQVKTPKQYVIGFAAETTDPLKNGLAKLTQKQCDAIFINDVSVKGSGFGSDQNSGWWVTQKKPEAEILAPGSKAELARKILDRALVEF